MALCVTCGQDTELGVAVPKRLPCGGQYLHGRAESSHQLVTDEENAVLREDWPCCKSGSTQWCQEAAACTEVRPCEHGKTARANTEKADVARSCGVYKHRHANNTDHGAPSRTT